MYRKVSAEALIISSPFALFNYLFPTDFMLRWSCCLSARQPGQIVNEWRFTNQLKIQIARSATSITDKRICDREPGCLHWQLWIMWQCSWMDSLQMKTKQVETMNYHLLWRNLIVFLILRCFFFLCDQAIPLAFISLINSKKKIYLLLGSLTNLRYEDQRRKEVVGNHLVWRKKKSAEVGHSGSDCQLRGPRWGTLFF